MIGSTLAVGIAAAAAFVVCGLLTASVASVARSRYGTLGALPKPWRDEASVWKRMVWGFGVVKYSSHRDAYAIASELAAVSDGMPGVFVIPSLFNRSRVFVTGCGGLRFVLVTGEEAFEKPAFVRYAVSDLLGAEGQIIAEGGHHRRLRKATRGLMRLDVLLGLAPTFFQFGRALADKLTSDPRPSVHRENMSASLRVITATMFGDELAEPTRRRVHEIYWRLLLHEKPSVARLALVYALPRNFPWRVPDGSEVGEVSRILADAVAARRRRRREKGSDLLELLLDVHDSGEIDEDEILGQVKSFYVAGFATSAIWLTWCMFYVAESPEWQRKLRHEVRSLPSKEHSADRLRELDAAPLLQAFTTEVLRLRPPILDTLRETRRQTVIEGYPIPRGSLVRVPIAAIQRMERHWGPTAGEFDPVRHLGGAGTKPPGNAWLPFLVGNRSCVGRQYARLEVKAILSEVLLSTELSNAKIGPCETTLGNPNYFTLTVDPLDGK